MSKFPAVAATFLAFASCSIFAQFPAPITLSGTVWDGVGRPIPSARVALSAPDGRLIASDITDARGAFTLSAPSAVYTLRVTKPSFAAYTSNLQLAAAPVPMRITLDLAPMQQSLVVAATGVATPQTQLGQSVQVLDHSALNARVGLTLDDSLREAAGVQISRDGAVGGLTSLSLRGSDPGFTKIMLDGVPLQRFDFGAFDFSALLPAALESVTVVSGGDSVVYGSDAAAGVVDVRSRTGAGLPAPELTAETIGGSFSTLQQTDQILGSRGRFDYAFTFGYLDTLNQLPNNPAWNQTWAGNVGIRLPARGFARINLRRTPSRAGDPGAFALYAIPDDSWQRQGETYGSGFLQQQTTTNWTNQVTLSQSAVDYAFATFAPSGTPFDPDGFGANYLGKAVTIVGANGYSVRGQAILDFAGVFPESFPSGTLGRYLAAQSTYSLSPLWKVVVGYRFDKQQATTPPVESWHDNGVFTELSGAVANRVFASAGLSEDMHSRFGNSRNPQASLAFLPRLHRGGWWNELRLHANAATAIKDPTIAEDQSSLYQIADSSGSPAAAAALGLEPIHPQRAHTFDLGLDQYLVNDQSRFSLIWFDDRYDDLIEFVPTSAFPLLGISAAATAAAQSEGGAFLNSLSESSKGVELELQSRLTDGWHGSVSYTYLVPLVLKSFSSDAVAPAINPAFPNIPIGAFAPLVGARPFRIAPESGSLVVGYDHRRWSAEASASVSSRRDDSTFLSDGSFGNTMLLPNHDLAPAYTSLNLTGTYRATSRITFEGAVENLLSQNFQQVFGYPSLGRAARFGIRLLLSKPE